MKSLGMRAVVIALFLLAITLALSSVAKASNSTAEKPVLAVAPRVMPDSAPGYGKHQTAWRQFYLGMDLARASEIFGNSFDPRIEFLKTEIDEKDQSKVGIYWRWTNNSINENGLVEELSVLTVFTECYKVTVISLDYIRVDRKAVTRDTKLRGVKTPDAAEPKTMPESEKK